jgi:TPR repeat protein
LGNRFLYGNGVPADQKLGIRFLKLYGSKGYPETLYDLGNRLLDGKGVSIDQMEGIRLLKEAGSNNFTFALWR